MNYRWTEDMPWNESEVPRLKRLDICWRRGNLRVIGVPEIYYVIRTHEMRFGVSGCKT